MEKLIQNTKKFNGVALKNLQFNYEKYFNHCINKSKPELPLNFVNWLYVNIQNNNNIFEK